MHSWEAPEFNAIADHKEVWEGDATNQKDAYEGGSIYFTGEEYRAEFEIEIDYVDRNGLETSRCVRVRGYRISFDKTESEIWGYCYLRNSGRTFYASRITRCVDRETGELIGEMIPFLEEKYHSSPAGKLDLLMERRGIEFDVLVYVGRLDGALRQEKRNMFIEYVLSKEADLEIPADAVIKHLKSCGTISKNMFGRRLTELQSARDETKEELIQTCAKILATKKTRNMEEEKVVDHIRRRLFPKSKR